MRVGGCKSRGADDEAATYQNRLRRQLLDGCDCLIACATSTASRVSRTSCARITIAPFDTQRAAQATEEMSRSAGGRPSSFPRNDLPGAPPPKGAPPRDT